MSINAYDNYVAQMFSVKDKTAVLIGAAGLLIGEMARGLAQAGARVVLVDINQEGLTAAAARITACGGTVITAQADITQKAELQRALQQSVEAFGPVNILVNGPGANAPTPFLDIPVDEWNRIINIQLTGTMLACQVFGEHMLTHHQGSIINISSVSSGPPLSKAFTYSVAKAGVLNLTKNLGREWATQGVRVNALRPGFFPSEFMKKNFLTQERIDDILRHTPMKRFGVADELVGACIWLCSQAAKFVTGAEITIDGGFTAMTI